MLNAVFFRQSLVRKDRSWGIRSYTSRGRTVQLPKGMSPSNWIFHQKCFCTPPNTPHLPQAAYTSARNVTTRRTQFKPFTQADEEELVQMITTRPRHVLRRVRQLVWKARKKELQFRNTVTFLMISLQESLRKEQLDPQSASLIMEGVMEECVRMSQHDMAHLLFRAFLRFRKYKCKIGVDCLRHLFESYKGTNNAELMLQLATEMKEDKELRALCIAAFLYAKKTKEAETMRSGITDIELTTGDVVAMIEGYDKLDNAERLDQLLADAENCSSPLVDKSQVFRTFLRVFQKRGNLKQSESVLEIMTRLRLKLNATSFRSLLRHRVQKAETVGDIQRAEISLQKLGYDFDIAGYSILISAYVRLSTFGDRASEAIMLSKVDTLLTSIEDRLKQGDPELDVSVSHLRVVIRGYGAAGKQDLMRQAWKRMQFKGLSDDTRVYNEMIKWHALMGSVKDVLTLKAEMLENKIHLDTQTYTWIFRSLGRFYPRQVNALYEEMEANNIRPDIPLYTTLLGIFGDLQAFTLVEQIRAQMKRREEAGTLPPSPHTYAVLMRIHADKPSVVEVLYQEARNKGLGEHTHVITIYLHCLARENQREKINELLISWPTWNTNVYNVLLTFHAKHDEKEKVYDLLEKMKSENVEYNHVTYGTLITIFGRWKDTPRVVEVMERMKSDPNPQISAHFFSVLASTYSRLGNAEGLNNAWEDLLASRLYPDTVVYNTFLSLYGKQHKLDKMQTVLENMLKHVPPNPLTTSTVVDMLGKAGKITDMEQLVKAMKNHPEMSPTTVTYHQVMNAYAKTADIHKMEGVRLEMAAKGYTENAVTYNILSDGYGRVRRYEQIRELLQERKKKKIAMEETGLCVLVTAFARARMLEQVNEFVLTYVAVDPRTSSEKAVSACSGNTEPDPSSLENQKIVFTNKLVWTLIDAYCRCGDTPRMEFWIQRLHQGVKQLEPVDRSSLIGYYGRVGFIKKMEEQAQELEKTNKKVAFTALNAMAKAYARAGKFEETIRVLHTLRDQNQVPDASTSLTLSGIFLKVGLYEQAQQVVQWRKHYAQSYAEEIENG